MKVTGEKTFCVPSTSFGVSASTSDYTLNYSVDGKSWGVWPEATNSPRNRKRLRSIKGGN